MRYGTSLEEDSMIGARERPYVLHWPAVQYRKEGAKLGFDVSQHDVKEARDNGGVIGTYRYLPTQEARVELGIPPGSFVKCCLL